MLKLLLLVALAGWSIALYPVEGPKPNGVAEANPTINGKQGKRTEDAQTITNPQAKLVIPLAIEIQPTISQQAAATIKDTDTEHAKQELQAIKDTAKWTGFLVFVGAVTAVVLAVQSALIRAQVKAARNEFIASHPPKLIVRRFRLRPRKADRPPGVEFILANVGRSKASIYLDLMTTDIRMTEQMSTLEDGSFPEYKGEENTLTKREYSSIKRMAQFIVLKGAFGDAVLDENIQNVLAGKAGFVFCGLIRYKDAAGGEYETRFFRTFKPGKRFLEAHKDPDYDSEGEPDHPKFEWEHSVNE